jgi:hypothetical protein
MVIVSMFKLKNVAKGNRNKIFLFVGGSRHNKKQDFENADQ